MSATISLEQIRFASPCTARWEDMMLVGDGAKARHCGQCGLDVHDLSAMTREEAEAFVGGAEARMCVRLYKRSDGRVITRDCPVGLRGARAALMRASGRAVAALALLISGGVVAGRAIAGRTGSGRAIGEVAVRLGWLEPFATVRAWLRPQTWSPIGFQTDGTVMTMGSVCSPAEVREVIDKLLEQQENQRGSGESDP